MISLRTLLSVRGMTDFSNVKIIRHLDKRMDIKQLRRLGFFDFYQASQSKEVFSCSRIIACIGDVGSTAILCGIYDVAGVRPGTTADMPPGFPYPEFCDDGGYFYDLRRVPGFEDLEDRVVIDWGPAALAWHQRMETTDKEVVEVYPPGFVMDWPGYAHVLIAYAELKAIVDHATANKKWQQSLSSVGGIYLILDTHDGRQYVGSACGADGIWGRWVSYAQTGHGGNIELRRILEADPQRIHGFRYSILHTLPSNTTKQDVILHETLIKGKLGSRAFGLNAN